MLYISLSDTAIEVIQTKKGLFGGERIIASSRKEINSDLLVGGAPQQDEAVLKELDKLLQTAYPKPIKDSHVTLVVSDALSHTKRLQIEPTGRKQDMASIVVSEASSSIHENPQDLEHFFKPIDGQTLYTAMHKGVIKYFDTLISDSGMSISFLCTRSFAMYELLKYLIGTNQRALYINIDKRSAEYVLYDRQGPIVCAGRTITNPLQAEISTALKEMLHMSGLTDVTKIIIAGEGSLEIDAAEYTESLRLPVIKLHEYMNEILKKINIEIDTGGIPPLLYANPISLMLLTENTSAPNFARDLKAMKQVVPYLPSRHTKATVEETLEFTSKNRGTQHIALEDLQDEDDLVEYEGSGFWGTVSKFLIWIILILMLAGLGIGGYYYLSHSKEGYTLPFISRPTPTPTITRSPTVIPTPTTNPNLKRSDLTVTVQNGTTKAGYAKEIADYLDGKNYKKVSKSNADNTDYSSTVIKIKDSRKDYLPLLKVDLNRKVDTSTIQSLDEKSITDAVVILGVK
jgi:hypothetical protein